MNLKLPTVHFVQRVFYLCLNNVNNQNQIRCPYYRSLPVVQNRTLPCLKTNTFFGFKIPADYSLQQAVLFFIHFLL
jgi:hypothetical protein